MRKLLVTGGAGFIGSNFIRYWFNKYSADQIVNLDKLTYAGHLSSTQDFAHNPNYQFIQGDICDEDIVAKAMEKVDIVVHFAAETHVDRGNIDPDLFIRTNVLGTGIVLRKALEAKVKRLHYIGTDEIFGQLGSDDPPFDEETNFCPRTPYAASKAGAEHLVKAYFETYGLPITITNCSNNYGLFHDPEKLIPRFITNLLLGKKVPLMGKGDNIRDWLYVEDHCRAIDLVIKKGIVGEKYCVGGEEKTNLEVTLKLLELTGRGKEYIQFVDHRLGHDFRYGIDWSKINKLGWKPEYDFDTWLKKTVQWYQENKWWWEPLLKDKPVVDRVAQKAYQGQKFNVKHHP